MQRSELPHEPASLSSLGCAQNPQPPPPDRCWYVALTPREKKTTAVNPSTWQGGACAQILVIHGDRNAVGLWSKYLPQETMPVLTSGWLLSRQAGRQAFHAPLSSEGKQFKFISEVTAPNWGCVSPQKTLMG